ncbi:MAG: S8 family serine peptidase, partial [Myxococcota bacterium]
GLAYFQIDDVEETTSFSPTGDSVDLAAPVGTLTTDISGIEGYDPGDYTNSFGGTSSACPIAAGIAALVISAHPDWTSAQVVDHLLSTVRPAPLAVPDDNGRDPRFGLGVIDPVAALSDGASPDDQSPGDGCQQVAWLPGIVLVGGIRLSRSRSKQPDQKNRR